MKENQLDKLACELSALSVFRGVLKCPAIAAFSAFLRERGDAPTRMDKFGAFVHSLAADGYSFSDALRRAVLEDENAYIVSAAKSAPIPDVMARNAASELAIFTQLTELDAHSLCQSFAGGSYIPEFAIEPIDFTKIYADRLKNLDRFGYGIFASAGMFRVEGSDIIPVEAADDISIDQFIGYVQERRKVLDNTLALIEGRPASNVLLCGDAGTGKSSTVKACANYYYDRGVRLIEIRKDQLFSLSHVMGRIAENPLKFIIFIDDLSFNKNDDCFSMLKAALEGSASAKAKNAVIYATSNRRHIVKETFSDRQGADDVHHSDTVQELMSLSDRFGLTVYFGKPEKKLYLEIVHELAARHGVTMDETELDIKAEAFALARGIRSPRAAEHFIRSLV